VVDTEQIDVALAPLDSDSVGAWFESRPGHRLSEMKIFATFLSPSRKIPQPLLRKFFPTLCSLDKGKTVLMLN
jgi:hypothetical protein